ncbi:MAG: hypothetical protein LBR80_02490 [Deltaproteobacteria bacterium]|jgi:hypothetical protein|nr:hypothetical protein [Deltaproteobacteria bacterium]
MKTYNVTPMQTLLLLDLLSRGGQEHLKAIKSPRYGFRDHRLPLIEQGLLYEEKIKDIVDGKPGGIPIILMTLTDVGYVYLQTAMREMREATLPRSPSCGPVAAKLLARVSVFMEANGCTVTEVFDDPPRRLSPPEPDPADVKPEPYEPAPAPEIFLRRLKSIPKELFMPGELLTIAALKDAMTDLRREDIDRLLLELQSSGLLVLYPFASNDMVTPRDKAAEVLVGGDPRHYLFLK